MQKLFIGKGQYVDQQGTEKKNKTEKTKLCPVFKYFADCANLSNLVLYADSFTIKNKMEF